MSTSTRWAVTVLLLSAFSGCVSSQSMTLGDQTYAPRPPDHVIDVFIPDDAPVEVHKSLADAKPLAMLPTDANEIGRIDTDGAAAASWDAVIEDAKKKARELGGDAIVIRHWGYPMTGANRYGGASYGKALSMIVVRLRP